MKTVIGGILMGTGILIAGASGLCSAVLLVGLAGEGGSDEFVSFPMVLMFGGIPFALGLALFFGGRRMVRRAREEQAEQAPGGEADGQ